jgi:uncharacterized membrane protein
MWWWNDYYWPVPWMFMPFAFFAVCLVMMFLVMRRMGSHGRPQSTMEMLDESRAHGEISEVQYQQLKQIIRS